MPSKIFNVGRLQSCFSSIEASDAAAAAGAGVPESPEPVAVSDFDLSRKREKLLLCYSAPDQVSFLAVLSEFNFIGGFTRIKLLVS